MRYLRRSRRNGGRRRGKFLNSEFYILMGCSYLMFIFKHTCVCIYVCVFVFMYVCLYLSVC